MVFVCGGLALLVYRFSRPGGEGAERWGGQLVPFEVRVSAEERVFVLKIEKDKVRKEFLSRMQFEVCKSYYLFGKTSIASFLFFVQVCPPLA